MSDNGGRGFDLDELVDKSAGGYHLYGRTQLSRPAEPSFGAGIVSLIDSRGRLASLSAAGGREELRLGLAASA